MELDQWLTVYGSLAHIAGSKDRSFWSLQVGLLITQGILGLATTMLLMLEPAPVAGIRYAMTIGLVAIGIVTCAAWLATQARLRAETAHLLGLLRQIEAQFAGGELLRSLDRFSRGEKVCIPGSNWTCNEWLPSVSRVSLLGRTGGHALMGWTAAAILVAWIGLLARILIG